MGDAAHPLRPTGQGNNQAVEDAHGLGVAAAAAAAAGDIDLDALQAWREARAHRVRPIVAFSTVTGRGAYTVAREAASEEEAAVLSMFPGTPEMSNQAFERYLFEQEFEPLGVGGRGDRAASV
jgi:2-polyprenyl-6-methoxyphenol hydroxylase-like FAD-dependent oxidoreductase